MGNLPMFMRTYKLTDEISAYVTPEYTAFAVSNDGEILGIPNKIMKPGAQKSNAFEISKKLGLDYNPTAKPVPSSYSLDLQRKSP